MKKIKATILSLMTVLGVNAAVLIPAVVYASPVDDISSGVTSVDKSGSSANTNDLTTYIKDIVNVLLFLLGVIAVIMIIVGGFRYTTSNGDAGQVKSAKDTIMYAVVGIIVAILAYAIVNFVIGAFAKKAS